MGQIQHLQAENYSNETFPAAVSLMGNAWLLLFPAKDHAEAWYLKLSGLLRRSGLERHMLLVVVNKLGNRSAWEEVFQLSFEIDFQAFSQLVWTFK